MLPLFPTFKRLELEDYDDINSYVRKYPPYSDYNFVSLYSYNTLELTELSILNNNLVVRFQDYITNVPFYSFLGNNNNYNTIITLLEYAKNQGATPFLKLIPEVNITNIKSVKEFEITEDPDNFDYILSVDEIADFVGKKYYDKRNLVNRFKRLYPNMRVDTLDLKNTDTIKKLDELFYTWGKQKGSVASELRNEHSAIQRLLESATYFNLISVGVFLDESLIGFSINETVHDQYVIMHFQKGDKQFQGIYSVVQQETARTLKMFGSKYINYEQDLGIAELRKAKQLWRPVNYLKKYVIKINQTYL